MSLYIHNLILEGEHQKQDFKYEISDAKKIARTFAAFANTNGGRLLIGVKDNGNISGIRSDEEEYMAEAAAHIFCKPQVEYQIVPHDINGKTILEIIVPESNNKPHTAPWKDDGREAFVRVDDQNFIAGDVLLEVWRLKHQKDELVVQYNTFEEELFELIRKQGKVTMDEFMSSSKVKPFLAKKILSQLVTVKVLDMLITEHETYYTLFE